MARKPKKVSFPRVPKFKSVKLGKTPHVKISVPRPRIKKQKVSY